MKKMIFPALVLLGGAGVSLTPAPALAGACEMQHTMAIAACNGDGACGDRADAAYYDCLKRQVLINE